MYKRINRKGLLGLISSFLGVFSICGLISLGLFSKPKIVQKVSADTSVILYQSSGFKELQDTWVNTDINSEVHINSYFKYNYSYYYTMVNSVKKYQFSITFGMYFDKYLVDLSNDGGSVTKRFYLADRTQDYSNISVNNLNMINTYSALSEVPIYNLNFSFLGFRSADNVSDIPLSNRGVSYFKFNDLDYTTGDIWMNTAIVNEQGIIQDSDSILDRNFSSFMHTLPHNSGYDKNVIDDSFTYGFSSFDDGMTIGYNNGYNDGFNQGQISGYNQGYNEGYEQGIVYQSDIDEQLFDDYYQQGYSAGYTAGSSQDEVALTILNGIVTIGLLPVKFFLSIFNFEILGINIAGFVSALLSICVIIIVWKTIMGGKSSD